MITDLYLSQSKPIEPPSFIEKTHIEICVKPDPKPIYCESPDELGRRSYISLGTTTYTITNSQGPGTTTSTTTT